MVLLPWHVAEVSGHACGVPTATATDAGYGCVSSPLLAIDFLAALYSLRVLCRKLIRVGACLALASWDLVFNIIFNKPARSL